MNGTFGFDAPWVLGGFAVFMPIILFDLFSARRKRIKKFLPPPLRARLRASEFFFKAFLACFIIALAGPRWGLERAPGEYRRGLDVVIAVDVSRSMEIPDAPSFAGNSAAGSNALVSRLERGLAVTREAVSAVPGLRTAAAVSRSRGMLAVPLTWDNGTVLGFLEFLDGSALTGRGTDLEALINAASEAFQSSFPSVRLILLVSDGEALSGSLKAALDRCSRDDIIVSALATGSDEGRPVPGQDGLVSRRNSSAMRMAAEQTGGLYIDGNRKDAASVLAAHLQSLGPEMGGRGGRKERKARWFIFIMASIIALGSSKLCLFRMGKE
ncbi:MAG: hypothetical protein LBD48_14995 [Treponema sp.]|nr:hypothetical protein [Treponema sp.]